MPDLNPVFTELRKLLAPYASRLRVKQDAPTVLYLDTQHIMKNKQPLFFASVQVKKAYVSFHLMPVYVNPELLEGLTPALRARMQGKSCFNFTGVDAALFKELGALTQAGYAHYKAQGFVS